MRLSVVDIAKHPVAFRIEHVGNICPPRTIGRVSGAELSNGEGNASSYWIRCTNCGYEEAWARTQAARWIIEGKPSPPAAAPKQGVSITIAPPASERPLITALYAELNKNALNGCAAEEFAPRRPGRARLPMLVHPYGTKLAKMIDLLVRPLPGRLPGILSRARVCRTSRHGSVGRHLPLPKQGKYCLGVHRLGIGENQWLTIGRRRIERPAQQFPITIVTIDSGCA